jgi:hypothetical protein
MYVFVQTSARLTLFLSIWICAACLMLPGMVSPAYTQESATAATEIDDQEDIGWPRQIKTAKGLMTVYQPQLDNLVGRTLSGRAAFSSRKGEADEPEFGALWFESDAEVDNEERLVYISNTKVTRVALPDASDEDNAAVIDAINQAAKRDGLTIDLDRFIAAMNESDLLREESGDLNNAPPKIIVKHVPSVLVYIDGEPKMSQVPDSNMLSVENTPYPIVLDSQTKKYYLSGGTIWYAADDVLGPYAHTEDVPKSVSDLLKLTDEQKADLAAQLGVDDEKDDRIPEIIIVTEPTELIFVDGKPSFTPLVGADLLYVENTETAVFLDPSAKLYYALVSGRWYSSDTFGESDWSYVPPDELPEYFAKIPEDSERGNVLAQVSGTVQAQEAVVEASIPQVTAISRDATLEVSYQDDPEFELIKGTNIEIAVNTETTVLRIDGKYYAVDQGVWYVADAATGPWAVADSVPEAFQDIPAESPAYNAKYVKVYDSTPQYVYVGYTPGYLGSYVYLGTVVYGTGYYYRPWWRGFYFARPLTWGFGAYYHPWGGWAYSAGWGRFHFAAGFTAGLVTGAIWRNNRRNWYGPGGYHSRRYNNYRRKHYRAEHYRNRNNLYDRQSNRDRNQFKDKYKKRDFDRRRDMANRRDLAKRPEMRPSRDRANNVLTDKSGNIYRRNKDGSWDKRDGKKWNKANVERPGTRPGRGDRPATRPGGGQATRPATRPGAGQATRPAQRPVQAQRPAQRPAAKKPVQAQRPARKQAAKRPAQAKKKKPATRQKTTRSRNVSNDNRARSRGNTRAKSNRSGSQKYRRKSSGGGRGGGRRRG